MWGYDVKPNKREWTRFLPWPLYGWYWNIWSWNRRRFLNKHPEIRDKMIDELLGRRIARAYKFTLDDGRVIHLNETEFQIYKKKYIEMYGEEPKEKK